MIIRRYEDRDFDSVVSLFTETVWRVNIHDYSPEQVAAWAPQLYDVIRWRERVAGLTIWVAESDNQIVGFCGLGANGHVDMLYVDYRFQRQGIARRLYQQLEAEACRCGVSRLFTEASVTAFPFFERMGFANLREQRVECRGVVFRNSVMERAASR